MFYFDSEKVDDPETTVCNCTNDCKFCALHKIGVYVVNGVSLLLLLSILLIYWQDVYHYCSGQSKPIAREIDLSATSPSSPVRDSPPVNQLPESQALPITATGLSTPVIYQPPPSQPFTLAASPIMTPNPDEITRTADVQKRLHHHTGHHANPALPHDTKANKTATAENHDMKQRSVSKRHGAVAPYESTGSNYFKQMMRGKKPVASISQYLVKKHKKEHEKKDNRRQKHKK